MLGQAILEALGPESAWSHVTEVHVAEYMKKKELQQVRSSCASLEPRDLGDATDSSKSGATFWNCQEPADRVKFPRMLVKGHVREGEYETFVNLLGPLKKHFMESKRTVLSRMVLGFKAFNQYWLVLEDMRAKPLMQNLAEIGIAGWEDSIKWSVFDIKPAGSNSPQRPACFQRLRVLEEQFGSVDAFDNWPLVRKAVWADTRKVLQPAGVVDESFLVQVAGPFNITVDWSTFRQRSEQRLGAIFFSRSPLCAYRIRGDQMAVVCVSILDYLLTLRSWQKLQNTVQWDRWTAYEDKLWTLTACIGKLQQLNCSTYQDMADDAWRKEVTNRYRTLMADPQEKQRMASVKAHFRCCCYTGGQMESLKYSTPCEWQSKLPGLQGPHASAQGLQGPHTNAHGTCSHGAVHWRLSTGGCQRIEAPAPGITPMLAYNFWG